jgi:hypothetical protein
MTSDDGMKTLSFDHWEGYMRALKLLRDKPDADEFLDAHTDEQVEDIAVALYRVASYLTDRLATKNGSSRNDVLRDVAGDIAMYYHVVPEDEDEPVAAV